MEKLRALADIAMTTKVGSGAADDTEMRYSCLSDECQLASFECTIIDYMYGQPVLFDYRGRYISGR